MMGESLDIRLSIFKRGMQVKEETFYLVREDVLPDAMRKTLEVKKLLDRKKQNQWQMPFKRWI